MPTDYSLADVLEDLYQKQLALEAAVMEVTLRAERQAQSMTPYDTVRQIQIPNYVLVGKMA